MSQDSDDEQRARTAHILAQECDQVAYRRQKQGLADPGAGVSTAAAAGASDAKITEEEKEEIDLRAIYQRLADMQFVGLAFSGGGIRSATFNLGIMQGLAKQRLLPLVDYLSTVSGGGYIGGWFAAWVRREPPTDAQNGTALRNVERQLKTSRVDQARAQRQEQRHSGTFDEQVDRKREPGRVAEREPGPIYHLRRYSNYLAPRLGFLAADRWSLVVSYLRNLLLSQTMLLPSTMAVLLFSRLALLLYHPQSANTPEWVYLAAGVTALSWASAAVLAFLFAANAGEPSPTPGGELSSTRGSTATEVFCLVSCLLLGAIAWCWFVAPLHPPLETELAFPWDARTLVLFVLNGEMRARKEGPWDQFHEAWKGLLDPLTIGLRGGLIAAFICVLLALTSCTICFLRWAWQAWPDAHPSEEQTACQKGTQASVPPCRPQLRQRMASTVGTLWQQCKFLVLAGFVLSVLLHYAYRALQFLYEVYGQKIPHHDYSWARGTVCVTTFGPPLVLLCFVVTIFIVVGLAVNHRSRQGQRERWSSLCARILILATLWVGVNLVALYGTVLVIWVGPETRALLGSGWLLTVIGGILAGSSSQTGQPRRSAPFLEAIARLTPVVFVVGILVGVSLLLHGAVDGDIDTEAIRDSGRAQRKAPPRPGTQVNQITQTSTQKADEARTEKKVEWREEIDDFEVAQQVYWLSLLHSRKSLVSKRQEPAFKVTAEAVNDLKKAPELDQEKWRLLNQLVDQYFSREALKSALTAILKTPALVDKILNALLGRFKAGAGDKEWEYELEIEPLLKKLLGMLLLLLLAVSVAAWRIKVNVFSLRELYASRLIRAYLGASRPESGENRPAVRLGAPTNIKGPKRVADDVTGLAAHDDLPFAELCPQAQPNVTTEDFSGPYLLVNTALNLVHGDELAWQQRRAESFVLTPLYCGSDTTGYRPTSEYAEGLTLGTAISISGAAASPNMGYHSSPPVTALLTIFNARLGAWLGNPRRKHYWRLPGPRFGFLHLLKELFGLTNDRSSFVYLSDGGHFENLGAYELIRRRCQYVIVSDASCDPGHTFEDLAALVRKCRTDFGIGIEIDLDAIKRDAATGHCRWHCAVGHIRYDEVDNAAIPGTLVYIKPSFTGDEPSDVLNYGRAHPQFPHESTANQFFGESQFESYRALGEHIAGAVFAESVAEAADEASVPAATRSDYCRGLFASISRRWFGMAPDYEESFLAATRSYNDIHQSLEQEASLRSLTLKVYPELAATLALPAQDTLQQQHGEFAPFHILLRVLQVLQNAWLSLRLDVHYAHPLNRGWLDVFRRWTGTHTFRKHWPVLRSEFGRGFVSFCERQMRACRIHIYLKSWPLDEKIPADLNEEFSVQWTDQPDLNEQLEAAKNASANDCRAWLIHSRVVEKNGTDRGESGLPRGIIMAYPLQTPPTTPGQETVFEFLVWIRGAYRNTGIGRRAALQAIETLNQDSALPSSLTLRARLPVSALTGPGGHVIKAMWLAFFHSLGFRRKQLPLADQDEEKDVVLEHTLRGIAGQTHVAVPGPPRLC